MMRYIPTQGFIMMQMEITEVQVRMSHHFDTPWPLLGLDGMAISCPDTIAGTGIFHIRTLVLPEI